MAGKDNITCSECGQALSAFERVLAYRRDDTYVCGNCGEQLCRQVGINPYEKFHIPAFVVKLLFGVAFIASISYDETIGSAILSASMGIGLLAWAIVPLFLERSRCESAVARALANKTAKASMPRTCSHCGGSSAGSFCQYCGSPFE